MFIHYKQLVQYSKLIDKIHLSKKYSILEYRVKTIDYHLRKIYNLKNNKNKNIIKNSNFL